MPTNPDPNRPNFTGKYVEEMAEVCVAAAVSGENAFFQSPPGWGKTQIAKDIAQRIDPKSVFIRLAASSPPEKVEGMPDPAKAMESPPRIVYDRTNTAYDPDAALGLLDEIGRTNEPVWDILLDALNRQDIPKDEAPTFFATSNFMPKSERVEAVIDRIAMWMWIRPKMDAMEVFRNQLRGMTSALTVNIAVPTLTEITQIRKSVVGPQAEKAMEKIVATLAAECAKSNGKFSLNPRRLDQWGRILFRTSVYANGGDPDFKSVHPMALRVLGYAFPTADHEQMSEWQKIAKAATDIITVALDRTKQNVARLYEQEKARLGDNTNPTALAMEIGAIIADQMKECRTMIEGGGEDPNDPRVEAFKDNLMQAMSKVARNKNPFKD